MSRLDVAMQAPRRAGWPVILVVLASLAGLAGCTSDAGLGRLGGAGALISEADESDLGAREHPKIVAAFGGTYHDPKIQAGLEQIVNRLSRSSKRPDIDYRITVLNSPSVNAFALPGGYLYATRGLLALANDADELAAVLAHEISHVAARHAAKRQSEAIRAVLLSRGGTELPDPANVSRALRESDNLIANFSRNQELEADQLGLEMAVRAGFDPFGAASFLEAMGRESAYRTRRLGREPDSLRPNLNSSHPTAPERIRRVMGLSRDLGFAPGSRPREREAYLEMIDGLLYGDDPREGFVRGQNFLHPTDKFAFSVPDGYTLQNAPDAVFAVSADDTALRLDSAPLADRKPLDTYLRDVWGRGTEITEVREQTVNGFNAAIAMARHREWEYRMAVVRLKPDTVYRVLFASRAIDERREADFAAIVASLRLLPDDEAAALKPYRIRRVAVHRNDTVKKLAARMAIKEDSQERFRLVNGLNDGDRLGKLTHVKIITE